jgi:hypothetical protein
MNEKGVIAKLKIPKLNLNSVKISSGPSGQTSKNNSMSCFNKTTCTSTLKTFRTADGKASILKEDKTMLSDSKQSNYKII